MIKTLLSAASLATMTFACAVGGASSSSVAALTDGCSGTYQCVADSGPIATPYLHKEGDACMLNSNVTLNPDGTILVDGKPTTQTWNGDSQSFQWCESNGCSTCTAVVAKPDAGSTGGKCTGTPNDCGEENPPYCSNTRGCYMATRLNYDNSFDNYCAGYGDSCDEMDTQGDCEKQGCVWKQ